MRWIEGHRLLFWCAVLLILLVGGAALVHGDVPLTLEEAKAYIAAHPDQAAADIVKLDAIEHLPPTVAVPALSFVIRGQDLLWAWQAPLVITLAGTPPIVYDVTLRDGEQKGFVPRRDDIFWYVVTAGAGFIAGMIVDHVLK